MEISEFPDREVKITVKILTEVRRAMHEQSEHFSKETANNKKVLNRNYRTEEYTNCTEKFNGGSATDKIK